MLNPIVMSTGRSKLASLKILQCLHWRCFECFKNCIQLRNIFFWAVLCIDINIFWQPFIIYHTTFCHTDFLKSFSLLQVLTDISKDHWLWTTVHDECQIASKGYPDHHQSHPSCTSFFSCRSRPSKADSYCILFFVTMCPNKWVNAQLVILLAMSPILRFLPSVLSLRFPKKYSISFSEMLTHFYYFI